jgi:hypothetical protein
LHSYALLEWSMNDTLQLQSAVYGELGLGTWTREIGQIPVNQNRKLLGTYPKAEGSLYIYMGHGIDDIVELVVYTQI